MKRDVELAKRLLESKGYTVSKKVTRSNESYTYSGHDVSDDAQQYLVTIIIGGTDGDGETGMVAPDYYTELVSAMDEDDAKSQVEKGLDPGDGIADVHLATDEEIAEWESDAYDHLGEAELTVDSKKIDESKGTESHEGWDYYEMPKDYKGPWEATQYTKDVDGLYLTIYPPQKVPGTTDEDSKDWHADVERADGKLDPINRYQTGFSSFEEAEKWINDWISDYKKAMDESSDTPHAEQYKGYSIQSYDDYGATVYKNGKKVKEFVNIEDAREYIDGLNESKNHLQKSILESLNRLHESASTDDVFKVGDKVSYSMLYGGIVTAEVVDRSESSLTLREKWIAEDTGETASEDTSYDIKKNSEGVEYIVTWEYHGHEGVAYPPKSKYAD